MDYDEKGTYALLMFFQWMDGFIPSDINEIADMLGMPIEVFEQRWRRISRCFTEVEGDPSKLINLRMEQDREEMIETSLLLSERGRRGGKASAKARQTQNETRLEENAPVDKSEQRLEPKLTTAEQDSTQVNNTDADADTDARDNGERERTREEIEADAIDAKVKAMLDHVGPKLKPLLTTMTLTDWRKRNAGAARSLVLSGVAPHQIVSFWAKYRDRDGAQLFMLSAIQTAMQTQSMPKVAMMPQSKWQRPDPYAKLAEQAYAGL